MLRICECLLKKLGCSKRNSFRLRGGVYRVFSKFDVGKYPFWTLSRRWRRHWLVIHSPSGLTPLLVSLWLAFPDKGILNCYEIGYIRAFFLKEVAPKDIDENSINRLRLFWENDEFSMMERILKSFLKLHLDYFYI